MLSSVTILDGSTNIRRLALRLNTGVAVRLINSWRTDSVCLFSLCFGVCFTVPPHGCHELHYFFWLGCGACAASFGAASGPWNQLERNSTAPPRQPFFFSKPAPNLLLFSGISTGRLREWCSASRVWCSWLARRRVLGRHELHV